MPTLTKFEDVYSEESTSATLIIGKTKSSPASIPKSAATRARTAAPAKADTSIYDTTYKEGNIIIKGSNGKDAISMRAHASTIHLKNDKEKDTVLLDGANGNLVLGGGSQDGDLFIKNSKGKDTIVLRGDTAELTVGGDDANGDIIMKDSNGKITLRIYGSSGDIEFLNADFAEDFDICENSIDSATPGSVMILNEKGKLIPCNKEYDPKVVGIIAGAGTYKPAIIMDKTGKKNRLPVAMVGKVYCLVDADISSISAGDMLTTSNNKGHAMKVLNRQEAFGTVIGKALSGLPHGKGLIPVLVNLQ